MWKMQSAVGWLWVACLYLVGERAGHDERGVAGGATQVEQAALSQDDDSVAVGVDEAVHLGLDVLPLHSCTQQQLPSGCWPWNLLLSLAWLHLNMGTHH